MSPPNLKLLSSTLKHNTSLWFVNPSVTDVEIYVTLSPTKKSVKIIC